MTDTRAADAAAALLLTHWSAGTRLRELPAPIRPANRGDAYEIQRALARQSRQEIVGWKIAATSRVGQQHIGVDGPLAGCLLADRVATGASAESPVSFRLQNNVMRVAEAEFAFRMKQALPARDAAYEMAEVLAAVGSMHPAIEVPDSRYDDFAAVGAPQLIADCACACWWAVGQAADDSWRELDLATHAVEAFLNGTTAATGVGANVLGDPRIALTWLANELRTYDSGLRAGDWVTTGTCIVPVAIAPGDVVRAEFGVLGAVTVRLADS